MVIANLPIDTAEAFAGRRSKHLATEDTRVGAKAQVGASSGVITVRPTRAPRWNGALMTLGFVGLRKTRADWTQGQG